MPVQQLRQCSIMHKGVLCVSSALRNVYRVVLDLQLSLCLYLLRMLSKQCTSTVQQQQQIDVTAAVHLPLLVQLWGQTLAYLCQG